MNYKFAENNAMIFLDDENKPNTIIALDTVSIVKAQPNNSLLFVFENEQKIEVPCESFEDAQRTLVAIIEQQEKAGKKINKINVKVVKYAEPLNETDEQLDLIPTLKKPTEIILKKSALACMGGTDYIRTKYPQLLTVKLSDGKTLSQYLDEADNWYLSLEGSDMEMWIKMFSFIQAVKNHDKNNTVTDLQEIGEGSGIYSFLLEYNPNFYAFFETAGGKKKSGTPYYTTRQRERICRWLKKNQGIIKFPIIERHNGQDFIDPAAPQFVYWLSDKINATTREVSTVIRVNTNIIDTVFRDYGKLTIAELDAIKAAWAKYCDSDKDFINCQLASFYDIPLKFLICLTQTYNSKRNYSNGTYEGNTLKLKAEVLDKHLGFLSTRITEHIRKNRTGSNTAKIKSKLLEVTFDIGRQQKWLADKAPKYENGIYSIFVNPGYFAKKDTKKRIANHKNE